MSGLTERQLRSPKRTRSYLYVTQCERCRGTIGFTTEDGWGHVADDGSPAPDCAEQLVVVCAGSEADSYGIDEVLS